MSCSSARVFVSLLCLSAAKGMAIIMSGTSYTKNIHWFPCSVFKLENPKSVKTTKTLKDNKSDKTLDVMGFVAFFVFVLKKSFLEKSRLSFEFKINLLVKKGQ